MEAENILTDHVDALGLRIHPVLFKGRFWLIAAAKSDTGQVAGEGIVPDIDHLLGIIGPRNAPFQPLPADRNIPQTAFNEAFYFVHAKIGQNKGANAESFSCRS